MGINERLLKQFSHEDDERQHAHTDANGAPSTDGREERIQLTHVTILDRANVPRQTFTRGSEFRAADR